MLRGDPIWQTSSTGPMSMPSSSDAVATSARRSPARRRVSTRWRRSFERLPWCAATTSSPRRSPSWCASRSARRRVLTNTIVVWCSCTSAAMRSSTSRHLLGATRPPRARRRGARARGRASRWWPASTIVGQRAVADEQPRDGLDRALRGRQADALRRRVAQRLEPLEREREVRAALVARDGVDLVDDHGVDGAQQRATARAGDEQVERLRRGHDEARRLAHHRARARSWWCRRCGPRPGGSARRARAPPRPRRSRRAGARGSRRCRPRAPSAATRRRRAPCPRRRRRSRRARGRGGRCTRGSRRASCPSRSARRSACRRPAAMCGPALALRGGGARRGSGAGTTPRPRGGTRRGPGRGGAGRAPRCRRRRAPAARADAGARRRCRWRWGEAAGRPSPPILPVGCDTYLAGLTATFRQPASKYANYWCTLTPVRVKGSAGDACRGCGWRSPARRCQTATASARGIAQVAVAT